MNLYDRYINGEDGRLVYADIYQLKEHAFDEKYFVDVQNVLKETFARIAYNLDIIYFELKNTGYVFKASFEHNTNRLPLKPPPNSDGLLRKLDEAVAEFGQIPLSLRLFYKIIGPCDFAWDYNAASEIPWKGGDPIQIDSLDDVLSYVYSDDWSEYLADVIEDDDSQLPNVELAADYLHKDNVSGGPAYAIELTRGRSVDSLFLNEEHETTFINYLRICMENCGFSRGTSLENRLEYRSFCEKVRPQLKSI